jgi:hypothetical protein
MLGSSGCSSGGIGGWRQWSGEVAKGRVRSAVDSLDAGSRPNLQEEGLTCGRGRQVAFIPGGLWVPLAMATATGSYRTKRRHSEVELW